MDPDIIYVTGGASQNDSILQIIADIFKCKVVKSEVSGSVALGAALRASQHCLSLNLENLENEFCKFNSDIIFPNLENFNIYQELEIKIRKLLLTI